MCKEGDSDTKWMSLCLSRGCEFFVTTALLDTFSEVIQNVSAYSGNVKLWSHSFWLTAT